MSPMRCNRCHRPMPGSTANDGACACGGLIEEAPQVVHECTACGKRLIRTGHEVWLELDQTLNEYHDFGGVPEGKSQGWFPFGIDCAHSARALARLAIIKAKQAQPDVGPNGPICPRCNGAILLCRCPEVA